RCRACTVSGRKTTCISAGSGAPFSWSNPAGTSMWWVRLLPASSSSAVSVVMVALPQYVLNLSVCCFREAAGSRRDGFAATGRCFLVQHANAQGLEGDVFHHKVVFGHAEGPVLEFHAADFQTGGVAGHGRVVEAD